MKFTHFTHVYTAVDESEARLFKKHLQDLGVEARLEPDFSGAPAGGTFPVGGTISGMARWRILVVEGDRERARDLISKVRLKATRSKDKQPRWAALTQRILGLVSLALLAGALFTATWVAVRDMINRL